MLGCSQGGSHPSSPQPTHVQPQAPPLAQTLIPSCPTQGSALVPAPGARFWAPALGLPMGPGARFWLLLACYLAFVLLGSAVFMATEGLPERRLREQLLGHLAAFQEDHRGCLPPGRLEGLLGAVLQAQDYGVSALGNVTGPENWDLASALFFAVSLLTTTGYGHAAVLSDGGKAFCVGFASLGLPMSLVLATALSQRLLRLLHRLLSRMAARCGLAPACVPWLQATLLGLTVATVFVLIPTLVLWDQEAGVSLMDAFYFCFMSLSTIGLGDFVPGHEGHPALYWLSQLALIGYLLLGLLALLSTLETVSELREVQALVGFFSPSPQSPEEDQRAIVPQDALALRHRPPPGASPAPPAPALAQGTNAS